MTAFDKQLWVSAVDVAVMPFVGCGFGEKECHELATAASGDQMVFTPTPAVELRAQVGLRCFFCSAQVLGLFFWHACKKGDRVGATRKAICFGFLEPSFEPPELDRL